MSARNGSKHKDQQIEDLLARARGLWGHGWGMLSREQRVLTVKACAFDWICMADAFRDHAHDLVEAGVERNNPVVLGALAQDSDGVRDILARVHDAIQARIEKRGEVT